MQEHDYRIDVVKTTEGKRYEAWCQRCPWLGPLREDVREAHADGTEHNKE